jgi:hypothetical protein
MVGPVLRDDAVQTSLDLQKTGPFALLPFATIPYGSGALL